MQRITDRELFAIPNLSSQQAFKVKPWEFSPGKPGGSFASKQDFIQWGQDPRTEHCFYSGVIGLDPQLRATKNNPVRFRAFLVADYDAPVTDELIEHIKSNPVTGYLPNFWSKTFSDQLRLIWALDEPYGVPNSELDKEFLKVALKELRLKKLAPGLDEEAFLDPFRYYECGTDWELLSSDPLSVNIVQSWLYRAGNKVNSWAGADLEEIPIDVLRQEMEEQYPGTWSGEFAFGARGRRFWDPSADNPTAAIIRPGGVQCFTGDQPFVSWREIFGTKFVKKYEAEKFGEIANRSVYDGKNFWVQHSDGSWRVETPDAYKRYLKTVFNLSPRPRKGCAASELDKAMFHIQVNRRVDLVGPFIHRPKGIISVDGLRALNCSTCLCQRPAEESGEWGENFPWFAKMIDSFFCAPEQKQKFTFLAWLKWFYENGYNLTPQKGQAIYIAGPPHSGKTFLVTGLLSRLVGGYSDGAPFLMGDTEFSSDVAESPIMCLDDACPSSDPRKHRRYTAGLKKVTANQGIRYRRMRQDPVLIPWMGRVASTLNNDAESMDLLPGLENSTLDKVILLRCRVPDIEFPRTQEARQDLISREAPHLARWLLDWEIPEEYLGDSRYGVKPFHHPELYTSAMERSGSYTFLELLEDFLAYQGEMNTDKEFWEGTSTTLMLEMKASERFKGVAQDYNTRSAGHFLSNLQSKGFNIDYYRTKNKRVWKIPYDLFHEVSEEE